MITGRQLSPVGSSLYGLALAPAAILSPSVAGFAFGVGVGMGNPEGDIGGGVVYGLGQIDPMIPAELTVMGGLVKLIAPIMLLYRMLLGSDFINMGACASAPTTSLQGVAAPEFTIVGFV